MRKISSNRTRGPRFRRLCWSLKKPPNADGTSRGFRLVTDFRNLNQCLDAPQFHMPEVGATQEKLRGAKFLTTLDMKDGYWNAGVDKDSQDLLSFSTPWGTFSYQVVPQGLISSAAWFQNWTADSQFQIIQNFRIINSQ